MITETITTTVRKLEAELWAKAAEEIRAAVDEFEADCWEQARRQLEKAPTNDD
jgi:hypothetical protein